METLIRDLYYRIIQAESEKHYGSLIRTDDLKRIVDALDPTGKLNPLARADTTQVVLPL